jgi:hypothetical protein
MIAKPMSEELYVACRDKEINGKSWSDLANELGDGRHPESLRGEYRRELQRRLRDSAQVFLDNNLLEEEKNDGYSGEGDTMGSDNTSSYTQTDDSIHVVCDSRRVMSQDDIIKQFNINLDLWKVKSFTVKTSEGYRKDRKVQWDVVNGVVESGHVDDSGKMLIVPMYHVKLVLERRVQEFTEKSIDQIFDNLMQKDLSPVGVISSQYSKNGKALIVPIADLHIGLLATLQSNNNVYNMEEMERLYLSTISQIKERVKGKKFEEVIFIIGNDFLNTDNLSNTTSHGTPQDSSDFWYSIVDKAIELISIGINSLLEISKVHVYNAVSNHDGQSMYGIMKTIQAMYKNNSNVWIDTSPLPRKYHRFGKVLIGITHDMKIAKGLEAMTTEAKDMWSSCNKFYWLLAHLHTEMQYQKSGLLEVYRLPTISGYSRWSNEKAFIQTEKKTQCFIVDSENGFLDVMYIIVD